MTGQLTEAAAGRPIAEVLHAYEEEVRGYGFAAVRDSADHGHRPVGQASARAGTVRPGISAVRRRRGWRG
ncbi:hypothetical protein [Kitasatospora sp. McL0602]|uniref:hypothetical protein n=1 Tax=Kitasatospora sp. McL0602 TaxID=3439530 RepID=UPI003F88E55D